MLRALVVALAILEAGWIAFDGARAFIVGSYWTPRLHGHGGKPGPWTRVVSAVGIAPRSAEAKGALMAYGLAWLCVVFAFARGAGWAWWAMMVAAAGALWYYSLCVPMSLGQLLLLLAVRRDV